MKNIEIKELLDLFIAAKGFEGYSEEITQALQDYAKNNYDKVLEQLSSRSTSTSFDGSNKGLSGGKNIAYWAVSSPYMEKVRQSVMDKASPEAISYLDPLNYNGPTIIADAANMTPDEWQAARKNSIGSSAISQVFGESPYPNCTNLDLYYQKIGLNPVIPDSKEDASKKKLMFLYGHLMEEYLQEWVRERWPDAELVIDSNIYADPQNPFLTANLDGMLKLNDGSWVHIEFKTSNEFNEEAYANDSIPVHYKRQLIQCQHIMGVWESRLICGFTRDNVIIRKYIRDLDAEMEQVERGKEFWLNHVLPQIPPEPLGPSENIVSTIRKYSGYADKKAPEVLLHATMTPTATKMCEIIDKMKFFKTQIDFLQKEKEKLLVEFAQEMGTHTRAYVSDGQNAYSIKWMPRAGARRCDFDRLKEEHEDIYNQYVTKAEEDSRTFSITPAAVRNP